jgi:hypothetical protein
LTSVDNVPRCVHRKQRRPPNLQAKAEKANEKHGEIAAEVVPAIDSTGVAESKATSGGGKKKTPKAQSPAAKTQSPAAAAAKATNQQQPEEKKKKCIIS